MTLENAPFDSERHTLAHRNLLLLVQQRRDALLAAFDRLAELREDNQRAIDAATARYGAVAGQRTADTLGHDSVLARSLLEPLSGTHLGLLILDHAPALIGRYPPRVRTNPTPPPEAA